MESKLEQYRLRKRRQQRYEEFKGILRRMLSLGSGANADNKNEHIVDVHDHQQLKDEPLLEKEPLLSDIPSSSEDEIPPEDIVANNAATMEQHRDFMKYTLKIVYFLFWATCFVIAIELQFGIVFLMFSGLLGIYFNTRTGPKSKHEISAYSVFNKDFESIDGTLKAEQFEREIRYGANSVR